MERIDLMTDCDSYTDTEDELVSPLHLDSRQGLNWLMEHLSFDCNSLLDYVYKDIIPKTAGSIARNNEDESEEEDDDLGVQS